MAGLNIAREIGNSALNENSPICLPAIVLPSSVLIVKLAMRSDAVLKRSSGPTVMRRSPSLRARCYIARSVSHLETSSNRYRAGSLL